MNRLAHIYSDSDVKGYCDYQLAFKLYKESAEKGNVNSMSCLGWCYHYGNGIEKIPYKKESDCRKCKSCL